MERLARKYPGDVEAKIFHALALNERGAITKFRKRIKQRISWDDALDLIAPSLPARKPRRSS